MKKCLIVVDYQNDFVSGSLGFEKAKTLELGIANKINSYHVTAMMSYLLLTLIMTIIWIAMRESICPYLTV